MTASDTTVPRAPVPGGSAAPAPIYRDAAALAEWIAGRFDQRPGTLARRLTEAAIGVHLAITLALKDRRLDEHLADADDQLIALRTLLRLGGSLGQLNDAQLVHGLGLADTVGRQLGGWRRSRSPA